MSERKPGIFNTFIKTLAEDFKATIKSIKESFSTPDTTPPTLAEQLRNAGLNYSDEHFVQKEVAFRVYRGIDNFFKSLTMQSPSLTRFDFSASRDLNTSVFSDYQFEIQKTQDGYIYATYNATGQKRENPSAQYADVVFEETYKISPNEINYVRISSYRGIKTPIIERHSVKKHRIFGRSTIKDAQTIDTRFEASMYRSNKEILDQKTKNSPLSPA